MEVVSGGEGSSGQLKLLYPLLFSLQVRFGALSEFPIALAITYDSGFWPSLDSPIGFRSNHVAPLVPWPVLFLSSR
jgi:hypothetical protein